LRSCGDRHFRGTRSEALVGSPLGNTGPSSASRCDKTGRAYRRQTADNEESLAGVLVLRAAFGVCRERPVLLNSDFAGIPRPHGHPTTCRLPLRRLDPKRNQHHGDKSESDGEGQTDASGSSAHPKSPCVARLDSRHVPEPKNSSG